ncbi:hypothetical protein COV19_05700 [Candidatus Woesearchaeota archaeon CG10_big_fil_rev_8_21_14_0_10_44_13]|nr:MAG: hypothetical protein COV19_05700 [Candidatus Woesearchaeota archaeon CG10_big_fil_rev_8_21_14_0_10_44_13]
MLFKIIVVLFVLFAWSRVFLRFRDRKVSRWEFAFWSLMWIGALVVLFMPAITRPIANLLQIGRGIDVVVYLSIILLFYLVFRIYVKLEEVEQEITKVVSEVSLKKGRGSKGKR